jgi:hypothetical protein
MYIVLMAMLVPMLPLARRSVAAGLGLSFALYAAVRAFGINLPSYPPEAGWFFNPLAWQALFMVGIVLGMDRERARRWLPRGRMWLVASAAVVLFGLFITLGWRIPALDEMVPMWMRTLIYPISKTNLSPERAIHFFALAYLVVRLLPRFERLIETRALAPIVVCGQHGLDVFCFGILLALVGRVMNAEFGLPFLGRLALDLTAVALLIAFAAALGWLDLYRRRVARGAAGPGGAAPRQPAP